MIESIYAEAMKIAKEKRTETKMPETVDSPTAKLDLDVAVKSLARNMRSLEEQIASLLREKCQTP